jgi:septal ring factor EnvC (AmiA/AmiB activator)
MGPESLVLMIPIAAIVMTGLVKIARLFAPGAQSGPGVNQLESRLESVEQSLASVQHDLAETQERLDFTERVLAQTRESKRIGPAE